MPKPTALPARTRSDEYVDSDDRLHVPSKNATDADPVRPGWVAWWVNVDLREPVQKVTIYKRKITKEN